MKRLVVCTLSVACLAAVALGAGGAGPIELSRHEDEYSQAHLEPAQRNSQYGIAVVFEGTDDLHYYADSDTAPAPGFDLRVHASAEGLEFGPAVFPGRKLFFDPAMEKDIEVYVGDFTIFIPFEGPLDRPTEATVTISGLACTSVLCLLPFEKTLTMALDPADMASWSAVDIEETEPVLAAPSREQAEAGRQAVLPYSTGVYYLLAILAGISINIMPCVLPVIPLVMGRLIEQSKKSHRNRLATGIAFCTGVILFFAVFALVSAIISITTGSVIDLNSLFRYPTAVIVLFLAIVLFALVMLDVITLSLPSAVTNRQGTATGIAGTAGMGFFAGVLSTPCSGALLGFVLVWAQTQPLSVSSLAFILMGVGMALPYAVFVSVPSLMERIPKPGAWMDIFKRSTGFLLFLIAATLPLAALPKERLLNVLAYGIIFSFCVWMWGQWVGFSTPAGRKWTVRFSALAIALIAGAWLLPARPETPINWQEYDRTLIRNATAQGRPVVLKFTADWCSVCKVVERRVYRDPEVVDLIERKNVLAILADTTLSTYPAAVDLVEVYGEAGNVPVTIVIRPDGERAGLLRGMFDKDRLIEILEGMSEDSR